MRVKKFLGFAFINYSSFEAADAALEAMNGQYLCNRPITIRFVHSKLGSISWDQKSFKGSPDSGLQTKVILFLKPMAERGGSDLKRL